MFPYRSVLLALALGSSATLAEVHLSGAWVRALPPGQPVTAAYLDVINRGQTAVSVTGARVAGADRVEIHTSREVDGLLRMEPVTALTIAGGETLSLAPGGSHLMLFDLQSMPRPGETRELCLSLEPGGEICTSAAVRKSADSGDHDHHQHH